MLIVRVIINIYIMVARGPRGERELRQSTDTHMREGGGVKVWKIVT